MSEDPYNLQRFVDAQADVFETALSELRSSRKRTHWMWFIFPQLGGLGHSPTAQIFGITSLNEAKAYLEHTLLAQRLVDATQAAIDANCRSLNDLFGTPDDLKFCSSMTLFEAASEPPSVFSNALEFWCAGKPDQETLRLLGKEE